MTFLANRPVRVAAFVASALLLFAFAASAHAADFVVDHTSDDTGNCDGTPTHCSLRQAFGSVANQLVNSTNTITVNPGTYDISVNGPLSLNDREVTINGGGATVTA